MYLSISNEALSFVTKWKFLLKSKTLIFHWSLLFFFFQKIKCKQHIFVLSVYFNQASYPFQISAYTTRACILRDRTEAADKFHLVVFSFPILTVSAEGTILRGQRIHPYLLLSGFVSFLHTNCLSKWNQMRQSTGLSIKG